MTTRKPTPRTCATHNPGSPDCGPSCPDKLREPNATPGLVFAMADGSRVGAPADVARAQQMTTAILEPRAPKVLVIEPAVGPESESEMDEAVDDIEQRDEESDEVDTEIEGDDDEGPESATDAEQAFASLRDELRDENANLRLRIVELERGNHELNRQLSAMRDARGR